MNDYLEMLKAVKSVTKEIGCKNLELAKKNKRSFYIGRIIISDSLQDKGYTYDSISLAEQFEKFINRDWGEGEEDAEINNFHIENGYGDVIGVYNLDGYKIWIQTDLCEDTVTTIYLPEER